GFERSAWLHKWNGYLTIGLLSAHALFQTIGYALNHKTDLISQTSDFIASYTGLLAAVVALGLFLLIAGISVVIVRRKLAYETWYYVHLYTYVAIALAFSHQVATGVDFAGNPLFLAYWCALYIVAFGALIWNRVAQPLLRHRRHKLRVASVQKEARGVLTILISAKRLHDLKAEGGQFGIWRFLDRQRWWQAHPFSISAPPHGGHLRITVKGIGDFTRD